MNENTNGNPTIYLLSKCFRMGIEADLELLGSNLVGKSLKNYFLDDLTNGNFWSLSQD